MVPPDPQPPIRDEVVVDGARVAQAVARRTATVVDALEALSDDALLAGSALDGWRRLTIACHLRYGAETLVRMTRDIVTGAPTSFYPAGRRGQRPGTLVPRAAESPRDVVTSLARRSDDLHAVWSAMTEARWRLPLVEPTGNRDLGAVTLAELALLRLTEVEVHGSDLDLGLEDWSPVFIALAFPFRVRRLGLRQGVTRLGDDRLAGSWLLLPADGPAYRVEVAGGTVTARRATAATPATATIGGSQRDLLALLLGRPARDRLDVSGDRDFAASFTSVFPGP